MRRPREGRVIAGVGAGLAEHLGMDVSVVRIILVVLALLSEGLVVLAYLAAAIFVPAEDDPAAGKAGSGTVPPAGHGAAGAAATRQASGGDRDATFWVGIVVLVVGSLWLAQNTAGSFLWRGVGFGSLVFPAVLIAFGLALWRAGDRPSAPPSTTWPSASAPPSTTWPSASAPPSAPLSASPSAATLTQPVSSTRSERPMTTDTTTEPMSASVPPGTPPAGGQTGSPPHAGDAASIPPPAGDAGGPPPPTSTGWPEGRPDWTPPPEPGPRERSLVTRVTLGLALVTVGALWLLRVSGTLGIGWGMILAAALLVVGLGLVVGSVIGRARSLILVGALLAPVVLLAQVGPLPLLASDWPIDSTTAGELRYAPEGLDELRDEYQLGAGSIRLDLRDLDLAGEDVRIRVDVGAGEIDVITPDDAEVEVTARAGIGQVRLFDQRAAAGLGAGEQTATHVPEGVASGRIELELQVGLGEISAEAAAPQPGTTDPAADDAVDTGSRTTARADTADPAGATAGR